MKELMLPDDALKHVSRQELVNLMVVEWEKLQRERLKELDSAIAANNAAKHAETNEIVALWIGEIRARVASRLDAYVTALAALDPNVTGWLEPWLEHKNTQGDKIEGVEFGRVIHSLLMRSGRPDETVDVGKINLGNRHVNITQGTCATLAVPVTISLRTNSLDWLNQYVNLELDCSMSPVVVEQVQRLWDQTRAAAHLHTERAEIALALRDLPGKERQALAVLTKNALLREHKTVPKLEETT